MWARKKFRSVASLNTSSRDHQTHYVNRISRYHTPSSIRRRRVETLGAAWGFMRLTVGVKATILQVETKEQRH